MAISRKRLEELIEQGATIYSNEYGEIQLIKENDLSLYENGQNNYILYALEPNKKYHNEIFDEDLFETQEEAREHLEFGNITRTERLPYFPKYENIEYERGYFIRKFHIKDNYDGFGKLMVIKDFVILVQCSSLGVLHEEYFNKPATRENYNEARRLCVKLFKGEEV